MLTITMKNGEHRFFDEHGKPLSHADGLKRLRKMKGWSTSHLAERLGVSGRTVQGWEGGRPMPAPILKLLRFVLDAGWRKLN